METRADNLFASKVYMLLIFFIYKLPTSSHYLELVRINMNASEIHESDFALHDVSYAPSYYPGAGAATTEEDVANYNLPNGETLETSNASDQQSIEHIQNEYYTRGLNEIDNLQLLDLSPLATWKLSSYKQGHGLDQLRDDSPNTYWQSDGSTDGTPDPGTNGEAANHRPHSITLLFSKKVSLERILIFCNYHSDESYTPLRICIMAGSSSWDLTEVCVVTFDKPVGWSHIIFSGVRADGLLKCFVVKIIILANHQDGKDSHIRAIRCFGKKSTFSGGAKYPVVSDNSAISSMSVVSHHENTNSMEYRYPDAIDEDIENVDQLNFPKKPTDPATEKVLTNVADVIGFNTGFDSLPLQSVSGIR